MQALPAGRPGPIRVGPKSTKNPRSITFHAAHRARGRDAGTLAPPRIPPRTTHGTLLHLNMTQQPSGWGQPLGRNAGANCWCRATARRGPAPPACPTRVPRGARFRAGRLYGAQIRHRDSQLRVVEYCYLFINTKSKLTENGANRYTVGSTLPLRLWIVYVVSYSCLIPFWVYYVQSRTKSV